VKRYLIIVAAFVTVFAVFVQVFPASGQDYGTAKRRPRDRYAPRGNGYEETTPYDGRAEYGNRHPQTNPRDARMEDVNSPLRKWEFLADANAIRSRVQKFEGLDKSIEGVIGGGMREMRSWDISRAGDNKDAAIGVQDQAMEELSLIRQLAKEEGGKKTLAAIDLIMLERQQRYEKMLGKIEMERRRMMRERMNKSGRPRPGTRDRSRYGGYNEPAGRRDTGVNPQDEYPPEQPYRRR